MIRSTTETQGGRTMRVKRVRVGIKSTREVLQDFVKTCKAIERGEKLKKEAGIYFEDIEAFRKALTPRRLELLRMIKKHHPNFNNGLTFWLFF